MNYQRLWVLLVMTCVSLPTFAQEQLGLRLGNYAGINAVQLNPALSQTQQISWDVNLVAAGAFFDNNYAFVQDASLLKILRNSADLEWAGSSDVHAPGSLLYDFYGDNNSKKFISGDAFVTGPSLLIKNENYAFGFFTNVRAGFSANRLFPNPAYFDADEGPFNEALEVNPFEMAAVSWGEIGLHLGTQLGDNISIGTNIKYLQGFDAAFIESKETITMTKTADSLYFSNAEFIYGYTGNPDDRSDVGLQRNGMGFAFDIGASIDLGGRFTTLPYRLKLSAALNDLGWIRFSPNATKRTITSSEEIAVAWEDWTEVDNTATLTASIDDQVVFSNLESETQSSFLVWMPSAINLQADYAVNKHLFVNATLTREINFLADQPTIQGDNMLAITPRFESRWLEVSTPIVWYNDRDVRFGTAIRLGFLTVGTDNLSSWLIPGQFTGSDIYAALRINPFNLRKKDKLNRPDVKAKVTCPKRFH